MVALVLWSWGLPMPEARANPDLRWRTIETEHFYVHYWAGNEEAADRTAMIAEKAYGELSGILGHETFLKVHVTLTDDQDTANGFANALPYPRITAYTTAPEALSVLEAYDDWLDILITHELVHVLHIDTVHGFYRAVNAVLGFGVLGKVVAPNINQPTWIIEGLATMFESRFSSQGRGRSAQFDAYLRMAVLEDGVQTLDQISSGARIWPHGSSVYLYGLHFMHYLAARFGIDKLRELSHVYASALVPYGINKAIQKVTGVTFHRLWQEFKRDKELEIRAQARRIRSRGLRQGRRLTFSGERTRYPVWHPSDGYIYFYKDDGHRREGIKRVRAGGGRIREGVGIGRQGNDVDVEHVFDVEDESAASFVGASEDMIFDLVGTYDFRYRWSDLHRWNGGDPLVSEQLTFGLRASEPHVSPDGRTVVFRRNDAAQSRLAFMELDTGDVVEVEPLGRIAQVYTPRWHPDGFRVAFSGWLEGGYRDIYVYDRRTQKTRRITFDRFLDSAPTWSPDGRHLLFVSDRDDVNNIYAFDTVEERIHQVSNVLGGAYEPAVSHDGRSIAYVGYTKDGYDLWVMPFDRAQWLEPPPPVAELPPSEDPKPPLRGATERPPSASSQRYRAIKTFFPRTLFPSALDVQSSAFGTGLGFETGIADVLNFHQLQIGLNYNIGERVLTGAVTYVFNRLWPSFVVYASRNLAVRPRGFARYDYEHPGGGASYLRQNYRERNTRLGAGVGLPIVRHPRHQASLDLAYRWTRWTNLDADDIPIDPNAPAVVLPPVGDAGQIDLGASYSNESDGSQTYTFGVERGRRASVAISVVDESLGGDFDDLLVTASYRETIPMPWRGHQSLVLDVRGGASVGGARRANAFCVGDFIRGADAMRSLLARQGYGTGCNALLRGYAPGIRRGNYFYSATAEYRIPLLDVDRGIGTLPVFLRNIGLIPFVDLGNSWSDAAQARDVLVGAGASLLFAFRLGYREAIHLLLQYAHGFDDVSGTDTFRAIISTSF